MEYCGWGRGKTAEGVGLGHGRPWLPREVFRWPRRPPCAGLWSPSIADSLPRNMFPANLVEATFKQVSGTPSDEAEQAGPAWARLERDGFTQQVFLSPGGRVLERRAGGETWILRASHGHTSALGSSFSGRELTRVGGSHCALGLHSCPHLLSQSVLTVTLPSMCQPLSWMRKLRHRRIKGPA